MLHVIFSSALLVASLLIAQDGTTAESFKELGSLFIWGIAGAVCAALVVVIIWLKIQSRRETRSDVISINPSRHGNQG